MLFQTSTEALFIVDRDRGVVVSANVRMSELLACDVDAVVGAKFADLVDDPGRDMSMPGHYEDVTLRRADAYPAFVTLFCNLVELPDGQTMLAFTARDTTDRLQLEREIAAKHTALVAAYGELEKRNREIAMLAWRAAAGELVAGMAHHLNNPVGALSSTLRRLVTLITAAPEGGPLPRPDLLRLLDRAERVTRRIESNVESIARASRMTGDEPVPAEERPAELAQILASFNDKLDTIPTKESV
nr:hypothetical protein [Kofleriaceae bacterium]